MAKDTRTRLIETTARLLQHRGYHGTSLNDILEASGAPRGSLYFHFPGGKDELAIEATRGAVDLATRELQEALAQARTPAQGVRAYVDAAARLLRETDYTFGCPVAPVILDAAGDVEDLAGLCKQAFRTWAEMLCQAFVAAGMPARRADALALLVIAAIEGMLLLARAERDCAALTTVAAELEAIIAAALPRRRRGVAADSSGARRAKGGRPDSQRVLKPQMNTD
jgi:TetR/AcrR family transcriptional repressor of lmrAB and yxaGH operons